MKKTSTFQNALIWFGAGVSLAEILTGTAFAPLGMAKGLAAIVIGEVLMGRLTSFYWKLTSVVVGSVIYFVIRAVVLRMGMDANDMKLLSAVIVALALCIPVALAKYRLTKDYSEGGEE